MDLIINSSIAVLGLCILVLLARGPIRSYLVVFLYALVDAASSIAEEIVWQFRGRGDPILVNLFWVNEILLDVFLFVMVMALIRRASDQPALRSIAGKILPVVLAVSAVLPFVYGHSLLRFNQGGTTLSSTFFNVTSQTLNFGGAIMNLVLWTALIGRKRRDPQLLAVSAGLGVIATGQALYYGLQILVRPASAMMRSFEDALEAATHVAGLAIWCWAFRPSANRQLTPNEKTS